MDDAISYRYFRRHWRGRPFIGSRDYPSTPWIHLTPWSAILAHSLPLVDLTTWCLWPLSTSDRKRGNHYRPSWNVSERLHWIFETLTKQWLCIIWQQCYDQDLLSTASARNWHLTSMNYEWEQLSICRWRGWLSIETRCGPMLCRPKKTMTSPTLTKLVMTGGGIDHYENCIMLNTFPYR